MFNSIWSGMVPCSIVMVNFEVIGLFGSAEERASNELRNKLKDSLGKLSTVKFSA